MLAKITKDGNLRAEEFNELGVDDITYYGKGNGTNNYILTNYNASALSTFEIKFKHKSGQTLRSLFGIYSVAGDSYREECVNNTSVIKLGTTTFTAPALVDNTVYIYCINALPRGKYAVTLMDENRVIIYTESKTVAGVIPIKKLAIFASAYGALSYVNYSLDYIYYYTLELETFPIEVGSGNQVFGEITGVPTGTIHTINGTLTDFWQECCHIVVPLTNTKMLSDGTVKNNEFIEELTWIYDPIVKMKMKQDKLQVQGELREVDVEIYGQGNGSDTTILTDFLPSSINTFDITFKYNYSDSSHTGCLFGYYSRPNWFGCLTNDDTGVFTVTIGEDGTGKELFSYMIEDNIYKLSIVKNETNLYTIVLYNLTTDTEVYNPGQFIISGSLPFGYIGIFVDGGLNWHSRRKIYSFKINSETWVLDKGTGSTVTGDLGTVLNINGDLTNFWQVEQV